MITRSNPAVGYMAEDVFKTNAFTQTIRAGNTLYLSGIAPLKGDLKNLELMGEGSMQVQTEWVLEILKRCLAAEGATLEVKGLFHPQQMIEINGIGVFD